MGSWAAADGKQSTALGVGAYAYADASTAAGTDIRKNLPQSDLLFHICLHCNL
ncbi:hypothetical protein [Escherichia coli]|uniref:hypothetical protein n=1 Tax=Escherichia coli TaxID=562 RepID=UPI003984FCD2